MAAVPVTFAQPLVAALLDGGDAAAVALIDHDGAVTRSDLGARVEERARELELAHRSVVALTGSTSLEYVVTYLALLHDGHVPLLLGDHVDRMMSVWQPGARVDVEGSRVHIERRRADGLVLHADLALLLSTSGTTGSPKLVRLSHANLVSNATAITEYLGLSPDDCGITTLPLHYCYGLSVLHSHLVAGASVVLTEASVVDPCFELALRDHGVTNVAGVPHTFELLERAGADRVHVPTLRFLTQAGGRMAPEHVARWVRRADAWGAEFFVMYGQTEATARMAYLPPAVARRRPDAIGVPIPGGQLEVRPVDGLPPGVGELVYRGANVMLGYAVEPADLAAGATVDELHTGDIGRFDAIDGVFEIVGRRTRFVKPFGFRIDLDHVERTLAARWPEVTVAGDDDRLVVLAPGADRDAIGIQVRQAVVELTGLPGGVVVVVDAAVPMTESGKVDHGAVLRLGDAARAATDDVDETPEPESVAAVFAAVLGRSDVSPRSTFVSLGGDSLNYIECSLQLERLLGRVPADWHVRTVAELGAVTPARRRPTIDTTVLVRAIGICAVVATHMHLWFVPGGAHLMLAVAGYNLSRFQLPIDRTADRVRAGLRTAVRAAAPTVAWVAAGLALGVSYGTGTLLLVNNYVGPASHRDDHWHFWFIEVFVHLTLLTTLVLAVPHVRRASQRYPYAFPLVLVLASLLLRLEWAQADDWYNLRYRTHGVAWFFLLGWLVHRSQTTRQRLLTTVLCLLVVPGFFQLAQRDWFITLGLVVLVWCRSMPWPGALRRPVSTLAAASMWIFITHFTVWPPLDAAFEREVAYVLTVAIGVGAWSVSERVARAARRLVPLRAASPSARITESMMCADANATQTLVSSVGTSGSTGAPGPSSPGRSSASLAPTV